MRNLPAKVQKAKALLEQRLKEVLEILQDPEKTVVHLREITLAPGMKWSLLNQLLVRVQGGTDARGSTQWAEVGRRILPGSRPIWIRVPIIEKKEEVVEDEFGNVVEEEREVVVGFRWGKVYDIKDTEGDPINPTTIQFPTAQKLIQALGLRVEVVPGYTKTAGLFVPMRNLIIIRDEADRMTLAHEIGHAIHYQTLKARGIRFRDLPKVVVEGTAEILGALIYYQDTGEVLHDAYNYLMNLGVDPKTSRAQMMQIMKEVDLCIKHIVSLLGVHEDPADNEPQAEEEDTSPETKASESESDNSDTGTAEDFSSFSSEEDDEDEAPSSTEPPSPHTESSPNDHPPIFAEAMDAYEIILHIDPDLLRVFDTTSSAPPILVEFRDPVASFRNVLLLSQQYPQDETSVAIPIPVRADEDVLKYLEGKFAFKFPATVFGKIIRKKLENLLICADGTLRSTGLVAHGEDISESNPYAMPPIITPDPQDSLPFVSVSMDYQALREAIRSAETVAPSAFPSPGSPEAIGVPGAILSFLPETGELAVTGTDGTILYTTRIPARYSTKSLLFQDHIRNTTSESVAIPRKFTRRHLSPRLSARDIHLVIPFPPDPLTTFLTIYHPSGIAAYLQFNRIRVVGMTSVAVHHATSPQSPWKEDTPLFTGSASIGDLNTALFYTTSANSQSHLRDITILARFSGFSATFTRDSDGTNGHTISINPNDSGSAPFTLKINAEVASRALQIIKHLPADSQVLMAIYPYRTELQLPSGDRLFLASQIQTKNGDE